MIHDRLVGTALAAALVISLPIAAVAQDEMPSSPEVIDWALTSYLSDDGLNSASVPFGVEATLRLEDGVASGSGGCNSFDGSYQLDGDTLVFDDAFTRTLAPCDPEIQSVDDTYLSALTDVEYWAIVDGALELSDDFEDVLLTFELPGATLTSSQLTALLATVTQLRADVDHVDERVDNVGIKKLRDRLKALEADNRSLKAQMATAQRRAAATPAPTSFSSAEKILLEGLPDRVATRCQPLRSSLPKGTRAAVACKPNTSVVASIVYYLMEGNDAASAFADTMATYSVPDAGATSGSCEDGVKSQRYAVGSGWQAEGCFKSGGKAEVRFVDNATVCKQLKVGGSRLRNPSFYMALQGTGSDIARVYGWATKGRSADSPQLTSLTQPIRRPNERLSPSCPT